MRENHNRHPLSLHTNGSNSRTLLKASSSSSLDLDHLSLRHLAPRSLQGQEGGFAYHHFPLFRYRAIYQNAPLPIFGDCFASKHLPCSVIIHVTPLTSRQASHASRCHRTVLACNRDQVTWRTTCLTMTAPGFLDRFRTSTP